MFPEQLCLCPLYREPTYSVFRLKTFRLHLLRTGHWNWALKSLRSRTLLHPAFVYPHLLPALQEPVHSPFLPGYMHRIILPVRFRRLSAHVQVFLCRLEPVHISALLCRRLHFSADFSSVILLRFLLTVPVYRHNTTPAFSVHPENVLQSGIR